MMQSSSNKIVTTIAIFPNKYIYTRIFFCMCSTDTIKLRKILHDKTTNFEFSFVYMWRLCPIQLDVGPNSCFLKAGIESEYGGKSKGS